MSLSYLLDEHVPRALQASIASQEPTIVTWRIGEAGAPSLGTLDPQLLEWCEEHGFLLVTNNRRTMPVHLAAHLAAGRHVPGIFMLKPDISIGETADELVLISIASSEDEYRDTILYLPIT